MKASMIFKQNIVKTFYTLKWSLVFSTLFFALGFSSCKKDDDGDNGTVPPIEVCTEIGTEISGEYTFENNPNAPVDYFIDCMLRVRGNLKIEPGTVIEMGADAGILTVGDGSVAAVGNSSSPIVFRGFEKLKGYWAGIAIQTDNQKNEFSFVEIDHASGKNSVQGGPKATFYNAPGGVVKFSNNTLRNGENYGYYQSRTATASQFQSNTITSHGSYPLYIHANSFGQLDGSGSDYTGNSNDMVQMGLTGGSVLTVTTSQTWENPGVPIIIDEGVLGIVSDLVVEPGLAFICRQDFRMEVKSNGSFNAIGTANSPIVFRGEQSVQGYWTGMYLDGTSVLNKMDYVEIRDGGKDKHFGAAAAKANLYISQFTDNFTVSNSTFSNSLECGIYTSGAGVTLTNNSYSDNASDDVCTP